MDAQHERRLSALLLGALVLAGCSAPVDDEPGGEESWSFTATDETTHARDDPANATVLFFMATWCSSCRQKAPVLSAAHEEFASEGVRFLSLDFDPSESAADIEAWRTDRDQPWPHGIDEGLRIQRLYGVTTQSTVLVLDAAGRIVERFGYGALDADTLRAAIGRARDPAAASA